MTDHEEGGIDLSADLGVFFETHVSSAVDRCGFDATHAARAYLVGLLADYAKPGPGGAQPFNRPMTFLLEEALRAPTTERFERLRLLGDRVLYTSGFFRRYLESKGVKLDFVRMLGARAYGGAANVLASPVASDDGACDVLRELAEKFGMFSQLLNEVADKLLAQSAMGSARGTLVLYESWLESGSQWLADALIERGLVPLRGTGTVH